MMFTLAAVTALAAIAQGSPILDKILGVGDKKIKIVYEGVPFTFTSVYNIIATPNQVVDSEDQFTGGLEGSKGIFDFGINSHEDVICYNITLFGFRGEYKSPAQTATHIHQATRGKAGPPRIAFPNPQGSGDRRNSAGCLKGPFKTGVVNDGKDSGDGFTVKQIEMDPAAFFADTHSSEAVPGAVRGQIDSVKCEY